MANKTPRVTKASVTDYCHAVMDADTHGFDTGNGSAQVKGKDNETRKAYGVWNFHRNLLLQLSWGEIYDDNNRFSKKALSSYFDRCEKNIPNINDSDIDSGTLAAIASMRNHFGL